MSSLINKSGVRFAPKAKQRRSVTSTPTVSRNASVTPSIDHELKRRDLEEQRNHQSSDAGSQSDSDESDKQIETIIQPSERVRRKSSVAAGPQETKQRRLSTLSNITRGGDFLFRKNSVTSISTERDATPLVISQPERTSGRNSTRRLKKSVDEVSNRIPGKSINILTPPATQQENQPQPIQFSQKFKDKSPTVPFKALSKSEGKGSIEEEPSPLFVPQDDNSPQINTPDPSQQDESQKELLTPPITADGEDQKKDYLIYDKQTHKIRKVSASSAAHIPDKALKSYSLKGYSEIGHLVSNQQAEFSDMITLEESSFKMADLCRPSLPIGRVSANFKLAQEAQKLKRKQIMERRAIRNKARMERKSLESYVDKVKEESKRIIKAEDLLSLDTEKATSSAQQSVQLKLGQDGNIIVDEESRIVDRHANVDMSGLERQDENPFENLVNSATYGKYKYSDKWDNNERELLYQGLYQWGTDFGLIAQMFPYRTRRQIKAKFISEEKKNPHLVELSLSRKLNLAEFNLETYSANSNKEFGELDSFNEKIKDLQRDHQENLKELSAAREKAKEEDLQKQKQKEEDMRNGWPNKPKSRKERMNELRKHETVLGSIDDIKKQREEEQVEA